MGSYHISCDEKQKIRNWLMKFSAISVRERFAKNEIVTCIDKEVAIITDPTLLLSNTQWIDIVGYKNKITKMPDKYIISFVVNEHDEEMSKIYRHYREELKCPVYRIMLNTFRSKGVDKVITGATPFEFVNLIANASFVITDSFHGTAFSINFNVPFAFIGVPGNNDRMKELLENCKLEQRTLHKNNYPKAECSFSEANKYLSKVRKENIKWIKNAINE